MSNSPLKNQQAGSDADRNEGGYVMATTALMLIPMLIFAAFAVDVGSWYVEAQQIQRASDAAALAGVVWMPDENKAREAALEITAINGYEDQPGDFDDVTAALPQVRVSRVGPQQLRVDIRAEGELYFGSVIDGFDEPRIHRFATSEYVLPVEFGSPTNQIGFGDVTNAWLGLMGYCQPPHYGDVRAAYYIHRQGCQPNNWNDLDNGPVGVKPAAITNPDTPAGRNPNHDPEGYFFVVDIPPGRTSTGVDVAIYDGGLCPQSTGSLPRKPQADNRQTHTMFTLWDATATPLDDSDIVQVAEWRPAAGAGCNAWTVPPGFEIGSGISGRYYVQVQNNEDYYGGFGKGVNHFSIEARDTGASHGAPCYTFVTSTCVGVYARDRMPVRTQTDGAVATFYLANVEPVHEGKFLEVEMYDLGEGMDYVQFINPQGDAVDFTWRTDDTATISGIGPANTDHASETCTGGVSPCLAVGASGPPKISHWGSGGRFNGRWVTVRIPLDSIPTGLPDYWWEVRYVKKVKANPSDPEPTSADWTTWATRVVGDPVRLIE